MVYFARCSHIVSIPFIIAVNQCSQFGNRRYSDSKIPRVRYEELRTAVITAANVFILANQLIGLEKPDRFDHLVFLWQGLDEMIYTIYMNIVVHRRSAKVLYQFFSFLVHCHRFELD